MKVYVWYAALIGYTMSLVVAGHAAEQDPFKGMPFAISRDEYDAVKKLLEAKSDPNPPLGALFRATSVRMAQLLLDHKASATAKDQNELTPLHAMFKRCDQGHDSEIIKLLVAYNADPNACGLGKETPLHTIITCGIGDLDKRVQALIDSKANVNAQDVLGNTLYRSAMQSERPSVAALLLAAKADPNVQNNREKLEARLLIKKAPR